MSTRPEGFLDLGKILLPKPYISKMGEMIHFAISKSQRQIHLIACSIYVRTTTLYQHDSQWDWAPILNTQSHTYRHNCSQIHTGSFV